MKFIRFFRYRSESLCCTAILILLSLILTHCQDAEFEGVPPAEGGEPGSIIIITVDTLRADHLGCYGYFRDTSPSIDELAENAFLFENAVTTIATTLPAHVSLWTSLYPLQTGITANGKKFNRRPTNRKTRFFSEMLRDIGYTTAAFVSATPVKSYTGIGVGFDHFDEPPRKISQRPAEETTTRVLEWLATEPGSPFFLWIHYFDPHTPREPPPDLRGRFLRDGERLEHFLREKGYPDPLDPEIQEANNLYDAEILGLDREIGRLTQGLKHLKLFRDSTLLLTADHGEGLGQHGWLGHGLIYNEQLFVPLILKLPAAFGRDGERLRSMVSLVDVIPTLVSTLGLPLSERDRSQFEGSNMLDPRERREFAFSQRTSRPRPRKWDPGENFAMLSLDWKYVMTEGRDEQLYDMHSDREELVNLATKHPKTLSKIRQKFKLLNSRLRQPSPQLESEDEASTEALEELRTLGYLQ